MYQRWPATLSVPTLVPEGVPYRLLNAAQLHCRDCRWMKTALRMSMIASQRSEAHTLSC